ncbi:MAG: hypothetical protein A2289_24685 [Deltaproteobacteria bacterium RIFOXYA12_FULL_58_15]|nr:MAG: hypothetical protein A2289_24685 [Deltaproteobacteria bacterium RIFOXYA12_FULL_58_15]OGR12694.1 MAG: hypothetical protein A2341_07735 [Deltaproteobacteria bacterium RIFOXYB12_FULL_58_9]
MDPKHTDIDIPDLDTAWKDACFHRERRVVLIFSPVTIFLYALWILIDFKLEPQWAEMFLVVRIAVMVGVTVIFLAALRATSLFSLRVTVAMLPCLMGWGIALMLGYVEDNFATYVFGFSLVFWGGLLLSWTLPFLLAAYGSVLTVLVLTFWVRDKLGSSNFMGAFFYAASAAILVGTMLVIRNALERRAFVSSYELKQSNKELAVALSALGEAQTRLVATEKASAMGHLLAQLSHEMNNPTNVIRNTMEPIQTGVEGILEMLGSTRNALERQGLWDEALVKKWADLEIDYQKDDLPQAIAAVHESAARITGLHEDFRLYVRGDAPEMIESNLSDNVTSTVRIFSRACTEDLQVTTDMGDIPPVLMQPGQINQVLFNLLQNAKDVLNGKGKIHIRTRSDNDSVVLELEDNGSGVPVEIAEKIFDPFFTTKEVGKGTGLGLATCSQIVERHGGTLSLDQSYTQGARFRIVLPAHRGE